MHIGRDSSQPTSASTHQKRHIHEQAVTTDTVVSKRLCTGCGTCSGMCPTSASIMQINRRDGTYLPHILDDRCARCGLCLQVCPQNSFAAGDSSASPLTGKSKEGLLGHCLACYLGYAIDHEVRYHSSSGGLVTALLLFALEKGMIDGALLTRMNHARPLEPEPFIARTKEEILQAKGSKYCPVAANVALSEILDREGKYAVVGLPCHIRGVRQACEQNKILRERIWMCLGIFCSHTLSFAGTDFLLKKMRIQRSDIAGISYRGMGWPGGMTIRLHSGDERFIANQDPLWNTVFGGFFFTPSSCLSCTDVTNELADISFGDPWLPGIMGTEHDGLSIAMARTKEGEALLETASASRAISLESLSPQDVVKSQRLFLHFKKRELCWRETHRFTSSCTVSLARASGLIGRYAPGRWLLRMTPSRLLAAYASLFYRLCSRALPEESREG